MNSISCPGWGDGSGSPNLYQVQMEILDQSVCENLYFSSNEWDPLFDRYLMICAGDLVNGGRGVCSVGDHFRCSNL